MEDREKGKGQVEGSEYPSSTHLQRQTNLTKTKDFLLVKPIGIQFYNIDGSEATSKSDEQLQHPFFPPYLNTLLFLISS
ncbi:hypothetical protein L6452_44246 [Arctium lappa]|uniref:Uncharacterized protein n=1 Tax=Arctium lappa TaxID=4217 RepID=A0ACB8XEK7_ARCLA|nr:hypothetical protein L6452_44246 [Arctium lappa]